MIESLKNLDQKIQAVDEPEYRDIFNDIMLFCVLAIMRDPEKCKNELEEYFNGTKQTTTGRDNANK